MISARYAYVFPIPEVAPPPPITLVRQTIPITQRSLLCVRMQFWL